MAKARDLVPVLEVVDVADEVTLAPALEVLEQIPDEAAWLASKKSAHTRRAYKLDVMHFMATFGIRDIRELRHVKYTAVDAWVQLMMQPGANTRSAEPAPLSPSTIRRRLAALSSLFKHLIKHQVVKDNPVSAVDRPGKDSVGGGTNAFSKKHARKILDAPDDDTLIGIRDRAILAIGFQVGLRREEIAALKVNSITTDRGMPVLRVSGKGRKTRKPGINAEVKERLDAYLSAAAHGDDKKGPLFRPLNRSGSSERKHMHPDSIRLVMQRYTDADPNFSPHSMRATFITEALENGAQIEDVADGVGHADTSTTRIYDKRRQNPAKSPSFFVTY